MSHSIGGLAVLTVTLCGLAFLPLLRARLTLSVPIFISGLLVISTLAVSAYVNKADVLAVLHRGETLTGRTLIWSAVLPEIAQRPMLGYGYSAFWLGSYGASGDVVASINFTPVDAHNGLLDLWLQLGAFGLVAFAATYLRQLRNALREYRRTGAAFGTWALAFLLLMLVYSMVEGSLLRENRIIWILFVANAVNLARGQFVTTCHGDSRRENAYVAYGACVPE